MFALKPTEVRDLMSRVQRLLAELADAWDPDAGAKTTVLNDTLKNAATLSDELRRYDFT